ncbi:hypothetical protein ACFCX0_42995, partial [Streptomyces sp. NPDC056352]
PGQRARPVRRAGTGRPTPARVHGVSSPTQPLKLYGHIKPVKKRTQFLEFCLYLRTLHPPSVRIAIVCDTLPLM